MPSWSRILAELTANLTSIPRLVEFPLKSGGIISVNPSLVLSVIPIDANTTEITPAGKIKEITIDLPYADVIQLLGDAI